MIRHALSEAARCANEVRENPGTSALAAAGMAEGVWKYGIREHLTPTVGFAALAGLVVGFDLIAPKTLTRGFHEALAAHPVLARLAVAELAVHLCAPKLDPVLLAYDIFK